MAYKVTIKTGSGKNQSKSGSISLPNKQRVVNYIKRSPIASSKSRICVKNTVTGKTMCGDTFKFSKNVVTKKFRF